MKSKLSIALLWAVIFVLGGVAGWFGNCIYRGTDITTATTDQKARKSPKTKEDKDRELQQVINDLTRNLQLDAAQQESLRNIFHETHLKYQELNQEFRPRYEMIRDESDDRIRKILHDDQRERFEELLKPFRPQKSAAKM
jgi:DNA anti-recombination protein RmuC